MCCVNASLIEEFGVKVGRSIYTLINSSFRDGFVISRTRSQCWRESHAPRQRYIFDQLAGLSPDTKTAQAEFNLVRLLVLFLCSSLQNPLRHSQPLAVLFILSPRFLLPFLPGSCDTVGDGRLIAAGLIAALHLSHTRASQGLIQASAGFPKLSILPPS